VLADSIGDTVKPPSFLTVGFDFGSFGLANQYFKGGSRYLQLE